MYKISNGIKIFSLTLILLGGIGWGYSYMDSHKTIEQVKEMLMNLLTGHHMQINQSTWKKLMKIIIMT